MEASPAAESAAPTIRGRDIRVLATDLDGTFLAGSARARHTLTTHFRDHAERRLLYVTGRSARSVFDLIAAGEAPAPDAMICDVGSFVVVESAPQLADELVAEIHAAWGDRSTRVRQALADLPGLRMQDRIGPYRVSYYFDDAAVIAEATARLESLDCDVLASAGCYLDVLPRGVNKGTTLRRLLAEWQVADDAVLAAGDTANDLSMFQVGIPAVAVGNAEDELLSALPPRDHIMRAVGHGCDGILEALIASGVEVAHV